MKVRTQASDLRPGPAACIRAHLLKALSGAELRHGVCYDLIALN